MAFPLNPPNIVNIITAQGRIDPNQNTGILIRNSWVTAASDLRPVQNPVRTYHRRPWKQYSRTVLMKIYLDGFINPQGWMEWSGNFALNTLYYGEYIEQLQVLFSFWLQAWLVFNSRRKKCFNIYLVDPFIQHILFIFYQLVGHFDSCI